MEKGGDRDEKEEKGWEEVKQKSLRQLAKELGVSHSYLSQIKHGKRPASDNVVSKMLTLERLPDTILPYRPGWRNWQTQRT